MSGKELVDNWLNELNDCVLLGVELPRCLLPLSGSQICNRPTSGDDSSEGETGGKNTSELSIRICMTSLQNLMSMMEATVSSLGLSKVGPKQTPILAAVIRLMSDLAATLFKWRTRTFRIS